LPAELVVVGERTAVALRDGVTVWAGPREDAPTGGARALDCGGVVLPGLIDAHGHLLSLGATRSQVDLRGAASAQEAAARVAAAGGDGWVIGHSWDQTSWPGGRFPDAGLLPEQRPVLLRRVDGHAIWVNRTALRMAGVDATTPDPPGGTIVRDSSGEPTGVLVDAAMSAVYSKIPHRTAGEKSAQLELAVAECHRVGLTGVHDAGSSGTDVELYAKRAEELGLRIYAMLNEEAEPFAGAWACGRATKLFADGALGSSGAWLHEPYADDPSSTGLALLPPDELRRRICSASEAGFQVCVHAIGDAAATAVLDVFEDVLEPGNERRFRIEHAQVVRPDDRGRMARLGVIASMQPTHATSDMRYAEDRLGAERVLHAYAWRSMLDEGVRLALGSDFPVESPDPVAGLVAAVTRGDWYTHEALTASQALDGFTSGAAFASFEEHRRGAIAPGFDADLTVLSADPRDLAPESIAGLRVLATIVGGRVVYEA
jgi:hypothetical protein